MALLEEKGPYGPFFLFIPPPEHPTCSGDVFYYIPDPVGFWACALVARAASAYNWCGFHDSFSI